MSDRSKCGWCGHYYEDSVFNGVATGYCSRKCDKEANPDTGGKHAGCVGKIITNIVVMGIILLIFIIISKCS